MTNTRPDADVSVLIPTRCRPQMLHHALASVSSQTAVGRIKEVIVSENGPDPSSREVAGRFPNLPIVYVQRQPELSAIDHFGRLAQETTGRLVAWLADDDMWSRHHIQNALDRLSEVGHARSYLSRYCLVENEARVPSAGSALTLRSLAPSRVGYETWTSTDMHVECLVKTPLSLWSLVCEADVLRKCTGHWKHDIPVALDGDRLFLCKLTLSGDVVVDNEVGLFARVHEETFTARHWESHVRAGFRATTEGVIDSAESLGIDLRGAWFGALAKLAPWDVARYLTSLPKGTVDVVERRWGPVPRPAAGGFGRRIKDVARNCCPPYLWRLAGAVKRS